MTLTPVASVDRCFISSQKCPENWNSRRSWQPQWYENRKIGNTPVSVPYTHREVSSQVNRDGVTDIVVKVTTDDELVGWGESCGGANVEFVGRL